MTNFDLNNPNLKQIKLVTGEEILCEVLDDSVLESIAVRNALMLVERMHADGHKYFTFKSFMIYQDSPLNVILIMSDKVVSLAIPTDEMIIQYYTALNELEQMMRSYKVQEDDQLQAQSIEEYFAQLEREMLMDSDVTGMVKN